MKKEEEDVENRELYGFKFGSFECIYVVYSSVLDAS